MTYSHFARFTSRTQCLLGGVRNASVALILVLVFILSSCASGPSVSSTGSGPVSESVPSPHPELDSDASDYSALINEADLLLDEGKAAEVLVLLAPYSDSNNGDIEFQLAFAHMTLDADEQNIENIVANGVEVAPAIYWAERSVEHGNVEALNLLYLIYVHDLVVAQDIDKAVGYLTQGAESGSVAAQLNLGMANFDGDLVTRNYAAACALLIPLLRDEDVASIASYYVGVMTYSGQCGEEPDKQGGMNLIEVAANFGVEEAQLAWGKSLEYGWLNEPDPVAATEWYERAAENGSADAMWRLGMSYVTGIGNSKDAYRAVEYFQQSVDAGSVNGLVSLGVMYAIGDGVEQDYVRTRALYQQAVDYGSSHAMRSLGMMLFNGQGGPKDRIGGALLFEQSAELGNESALGELDNIRRDLSTAESAKVQALLEDWLQRE